MARPVDLSLSVPRISLNKAELAAAIGFCVNTVDLMVKEGYLPPPKRWKSRKVWLVADVAAAMAGWPDDGEGIGEGDADDGEDWRASA